MDTRMLWTDTAEGNFLINNGGVILADSATFPGLRKVIESQGYLCAELAPPGPARRGQLSMLMEEGIELALEKLGAVAPGIGASANVDASISDQLYRARLVEKRGIVVMIPSLEGLSNLNGILDGDDSLTLSWWMQVTQERPLGLVIESENRMLRVYPAPVPFESLLRSKTYPPPPPTAPDQAASADAMELSEQPPGVIVPKAPRTPRELVDDGAAHESLAERPGDGELGSEVLKLAPESVLQAEDGETSEPDSLPGDDEDRPATENVTATASAASELEPAEGAGLSAPIVAHSVVTLEENDSDEASQGDSDEAPPSAVVQTAPAVEPLEIDAEDLVTGALEPATLEERAQERLSAVGVHDARTVRLAPSADILRAARNGELDSVSLDSKVDSQPEPAQAATEAAPIETLGTHDSQDDREEAPEEPAAHSSGAASPAPRAKDLDDETQDPFHRLAQREWPNWMRELISTRGPKPLAVVERTFVSAYTPLKEAWLRNIATPQALPALKAFADSFEHSYSEAFDALRVRGKRPTMVLDIPEIAQRIGRLHGARSIQLVLVDGMRFDVGLRVQDRLRRLSRGQVSLAERLLLWSALPTTTETQFELIGRGSVGLKEPIQPSETPVVVARGKNAATPRRMKAGPKELIKLDIIEANLAEPGKREATRLDEMADAVADAMADYFLKLPPRTLVMMFGDHGFLLDHVVGGTSAGRSGGASPEEVLVPAFAWLVGSVH